MNYSFELMCGNNTDDSICAICQRQVKHLNRMFLSYTFVCNRCVRDRYVDTLPETGHLGYKNELSDWSPKIRSKKDLVSYVSNNEYLSELREQKGNHGKLIRVINDECTKRFRFITYNASDFDLE